MIIEGLKYFCKKKKSIHCSLFICILKACIWFLLSQCFELNSFVIGLHTDTMLSDPHQSPLHFKLFQSSWYVLVRPELTLLSNQQTQKRMQEGRCGLLMSPLFLLLTVRLILKQVPLTALTAINWVCWRKDSLCMDLTPPQQFLPFVFNLHSASTICLRYLAFST